jgi:hypothetical protein
VLILRILKLVSNSVVYSGRNKMELKFIDNQEQGCFRFHNTIEERKEPGTKLMTDSVTKHIVESFNTPLTGAYTWDYEVGNQKIWKLYELGKKLNWDTQTDIDWDTPLLSKDQAPIDDIMFLGPFLGWEPFEALSDSDKMRFRWHVLAEALSNFLHGEQGALLVASQLVTCAPTDEAKMYAASQTFDEARHVDTYRLYLEKRIGFMYPCNKYLKALLDTVLTHPKWDIKFIGMQIVIESLALAAFDLMRQLSHDPVLTQVTEYVIRDEGRHVGFGVTFLEEYYKSGVLSSSEIEERAMFTYEAAQLMRERLVITQAAENLFGWDPMAVRERIMTAAVMDMFRDLLFTRLMPNVKKIGLLTDTVRPLYEKLGALTFEELPDATNIDWVAESKPFASSQKS